MYISNSEIENAALILLKDKDAFYDGDKNDKVGERIDAIKLFESKNIVACPGSGKTTTLLAKLIILANKMPFDDGRGICVFTHTNVAIDKIKNELGAKSDALFRYPNFFGTIQSFINKYLAIPSYISKNGFRPIIDNDKYYAAVQKYYKKSGILSKYKSWIEAQVMYNDIESYLYVAHMRFKYGNSDIIAKDIFKEAFVETNKDHYKSIKRFKKMIYNYGFLPFDEAYTEAYEFLITNRNIANAISNRFKYVFVDEMQDSGAHQIEILNELFLGKSNVVYQCYGDPNQAIYNDNKIEGSWNPVRENSLHISSTKRFSNTICKSINTLRVNFHNEPETITSSSDNISQSSHIILFDDNKIEQVIEKYAEIISDKVLDNKHGFYAVGRIIKKPAKGQFSIKSYFPEFERETKLDKEDYTNLESYLIARSNSTIRKRKNMILNSILYLLEQNNIKNSLTNRKYSRNSLLNFLKEIDEENYIKLMIKIAKWIKELDLDGDNLGVVKKDIFDFYEILFNKYWEIKLVGTDDFFVEKSSISKKMISSTDLSKKEIIIKKGSSEEVTIPISINTINGEKGKTHTATLYLETFSRVYDIEKVINFLCGEKIKLITKGNNKGKINESKTPRTQLKYAYVGMSRPTDLLCIAVRSPVITPEIKKKLIDNNWVINDELCQS